MPEISLTDFVDIVSTSGTPKLTKVRRVKNRAPYSPAMDFYKPFGDHLTDVHRQGLNRNHLRNILPTLTDQKKIANYPALVQGYSRWWGRKQVVWFNPHNDVWSANNVYVRVNPELGLRVNNTPYLIKLYLKADRLSKPRIDIITHLMDICLSQHCSQVTVMSVLDVRRAHLISPTVPISGLTAALGAELAYVSALWPHV